MKRQVNATLQKILITAAFALVSFGASQASAVSPEWIRISFQTKTFLSDIYSKSIAQGVWLKTANRPEFLPPIQYLTRPAKGALAEQSVPIARDILANFGFSLNGSKNAAFALHDGPFKAGMSGELTGYFSEFQSSTSDGQILLTCMAFVKRGSTVTAIYTQGFKSALPTCTHELIGLAKSKFLFAENPALANVPVKAPRSKI